MENSFSKNQLATNGLSYFWVLNSIPLVRVSVSVPVLCCFDFYSFVAYLAVMRSLPALVFFCLFVYFFKVALVWFGSSLLCIFVVFCTSRGISGLPHSFLLKNMIGMWMDWIITCIKYINTKGTMSNVTVILPICKHQRLIPLLEVFLIIFQQNLQFSLRSLLLL